MPEDFTPVSGMMDGVSLDRFWAGMQIHKQKLLYFSAFVKTTVWLQTAPQLTCPSAYANAQVSAVCFASAERTNTKP